MHILLCRPRILSLILGALLLSACVSPKVVHQYDKKCDVITRKMELTLEKTKALDACSNQECVAQVIGGALIFTVSSVVSGSVALVGNVLFWMEESADCKAMRASPSAQATVPLTSRVGDSHENSLPLTL